MLNERFITYFKENFFNEKESELTAFLKSIENPIPRTIRIKQGVLAETKKRLEQDGWILNPTNISNVFSLDRKTDFNPLERRIGFSVDHLVGNFYIQELAAAHPVDILSEGHIHDDTFLILDMASSPGGKTTQLTEYFPNSFIIANEPTRERIPQLLQNTERMGSSNIGITLFPGQVWKGYPEIFDKILLDAPCSGEGTLYKGTDAVKHWHIKNIKEIAKLQTKLLDAALHALKKGGEMVYSTCSLNLLENEGVLLSMKEKYGDAFEITFQKKFWPHTDKTGGFFVARIKKHQSLPIHAIKEQHEKVAHKNGELRAFRGSIAPWKTQSEYNLFEHEGKILAVKNQEISKPIRESAYVMRYGEQIGTIEHGRYTPSNRSWKYLETSHLTRHELNTEDELDRYLRGEVFQNSAYDVDTYILVTYQGMILGLEKQQDGIIRNTFSPEWRRR